MNSKQLHKVSRFLSLVLRHKPEAIGVELDPQGWVSVNDIIDGMSDKGTTVSKTDIVQIVNEDDKGRYSLKTHNHMIMVRANQGHSIKVDLELEEQTPPDTLYHGTPDKFVDSIMKEGLKPMQRHHVHLSSDIKTAKQVGGRRGKPHIFEIDTKPMLDEGVKFYKSDNGVWLTDEVQPKFLRGIYENR